VATAEAYDQWDDPGLTFTDTQCAEFRPQTTAAVRMNELLEMIPLALRRSQLGEKAQWWTQVAHKMVDCVTWYAVVAELPGIDRAEVLVEPEATKEVTVAARKLGEPQEFMATWHQGVRAELLVHVTLGRRCSGSRKVSGWTKRDRSISNKVANALNKELSTCGRLETMLASRTSAKGGGG
jgi:hypothetical protein